jgi:hypothetical protein
MWNDVVRGTNIPADLEASLLHLRTDSRVGSGEETSIRYYDKDDERAGGIAIKFSSIVEYALMDCQLYTNLPVSPPDEQVKYWVIEKRGLRTVIRCNGKEVLDITASNKICDKKKFKNSWATSWERQVSTIVFQSKSDTASDSYHIG